MQTKIKFLDFNALKALVVLAVCSIMFTSCYEKDGIDVVTLPDPVYTITGNLISQANGAPVSGALTINGTAVTATNGYFSYTAAAAGKYEIKVSLAGYLDATRTVYLSTAYKGQTSTAHADIVLYNAASVAPVTPVVDNPATKAEAAAVAAATKTAITTALSTVTGMTTGTPVVSTLDDGSTKVTIPVKFASKTANTVSVPYYALKGFISDITPATKALTRGEIWIAAAAKYLNRIYGYSVEQLTATVSVMQGYYLTGYTIEYVMANRALKFNVSTTGGSDELSGIATYQARITIYPLYESHDGHDTHDTHNDGHGITPSAGGGSSYNY